MLEICLDADLIVLILVLKYVFLIIILSVISKGSRHLYV